MKNLKLNQLMIPVTAGLLLSSASVLAGDNQSPTASNDDMQSWQETKRDAKQYWGEFKQDAKQTWGNSKEAFRDGWIEGKLQSVLLMSEHIDVNEIDIDVTDYVATLSGEVQNQVSKELAEELAKGVEGINEVDNQIKVNKDKGQTAKTEKKSEPTIGDYISNSILTAELKLDLIQSDAVPAMSIDVDVTGDVVLLEGEVSDEGIKELAEKIVSNHPNVRDVINRIEINS